MGVARDYASKILRKAALGDIIVCVGYRPVYTLTANGWFQSTPQSRYAESNFTEYELLGRLTALRLSGKELVIL